MALRRFPDGFTWGTATAAHQIEGGNWNNDWWMWEHDPSSGCAEPSGDACDSYHRYGEDIALIAELGLDNYRFSLEWSRIEPVVTYHHFTTPRWLAARGGWEDPATADRFARFAERAAEALGDLTTRACTINEPNMVATIGYLGGAFPPGVRDRARRRAVNAVFVDAHRKAYEAIKSGPGDAPVGLTVAMADFQALEGAEAKRAQILDQLEDVFLAAAVGDDF